MSQASAQSSWMDIGAPRVLRVSPLYRHGNWGPEHTGDLEEVSRERKGLECRTPDLWLSVLPRCPP